MANTNAPFGFRHVGHFGGVTANFAMTDRKIAAADTTKIYHGDPVKALNTGYVAQWTAGTAVSQLAGIFVGCEYLDTNLGWVWRPYWPGPNNGNDARALIIPCNLASPPEFLVQSSGTAITLADIGANAEVTIGTGSTVHGRSGASLNQASLAATETLPFRIVGIYDSVGPGSDAASSYNWVRVAANVSGAGSTGI